MGKGGLVVTTSEVQNAVYCVAGKNMFASSNFRLRNLSKLPEAPLDCQRGHVR